MIPKNLASVVENYVFRGDMIARDGNKKYDTEGVLDNILKISQRSLAEDTSMEEALFNQFSEDWFAESDPSCDRVESNGRKEKIESYFLNFWHNNPEAVKGFEEKFEKYASCLNDYNITLLSRPNKKLDSFSSKNLMKNFMLMKQKISQMGQNVDDEFHKITAYKEMIVKVAEKIIGKTKEKPMTENEDYQEYLSYCEEYSKKHVGFGGLGRESYESWKKNIKLPSFLKNLIFKK